MDGLVEGPYIEHQCCLSPLYYQNAKGFTRMQLCINRTVVGGCMGEVRCGVV